MRLTALAILSVLLLPRSTPAHAQDGGPLPRRIQPDSIVCGPDEGAGEDPPPTVTQLYLEAADVTPPRLKRLRKGNKYPTALQEAGITGHATVEFTVGLDGRADPCTIVLVESTHRDFAAAAMYTILDSEFEPARVDDRKLRVRVRQRFNYTR